MSHLFSNNLRAVLFVAMLAVFALAIGAFQGTAHAQEGGGEDVPSHVTITNGGGAGPQLVIECAWGLPDMTPGTTAMHYEAPGTPIDIYDDTPAELAEPNPCDGVNPAETGRQHMFGVLPNVDDAPIERQYEKWISVEGQPGSIVDVHFNVWEPYDADAPGGPPCDNRDTDAFGAFEDTDGVIADYCFKYQHHATANLEAPSVSNPLQYYGQGVTGSFNCNNLQDGVNAADSMFEAAVGTGQMTLAEVDAIQQRCYQDKSIFRVRELISKEQPCGEYRVEAVAVNTAGEKFSTVFYFDVLCFYYLATDFTSVDWGTIQNGQVKYVNGDTCFVGALLTDPDCTAAPNGPTIRNMGNIEFWINIHFDPLVCGPTVPAGQDPATWQTCSPLKQIIDFDLQLRADWQPFGNITNVPSIVASQWYCFGSHPLIHNQDAKVDFSVHPTGAVEGDYLGAIQIVAEAVPCDGFNSGPAVGG